MNTYDNYFKLLGITEIRLILNYQSLQKRGLITMPTGVYTTTKKDGTTYYRASLLFKINTSALAVLMIYKASLVYKEACSIVSDSANHWININLQLTSYDKKQFHISFDKYICLINYRDNNIYIKTPIYLCKKYFLYFLDINHYINI